MQENARLAMEAKIECLTSGIQKQTGTKSSRRLEAAISSMKALERQAAIMQSPVVQRTASSRAFQDARKAPQREDGLDSMRQRLAEMERRARERTRLQSLQQQQQQRQQQQPDDSATENRADVTQSADMKAAKEEMLSVLCANGVSLKELEVAASALKRVVDQADEDASGLSEATVMLGAAQTRMRRLQGPGTSLKTGAV